MTDRSGAVSGYATIMSNALQSSLHWWNAWQERSVNRRIFAAMVTVGGFTALAKLVAAAKEIVIAYQFGTSDALDAFLIAFALPGFAINLIGVSLNAALIPTYVQVREQEGREAAHRLLSSVVVLSSGFLLAFSVLLAVSAPILLPLVASGFAPEKLALTRWLFYLLLSTVVLSGLATTWGAVLNAENRFALPAFVPIGTSIVTIVVVTYMAKRWGIYAFAFGSIGGAVIEAGLLGWALAREGVSLVPRWSGISPAVKQVLAQYTPMVAAAFLMCSTSIVSQSMAAMLDPGSVSVLTYGSKITALMLGIAAIAVSTAVLPHFSRMVTASDWRGIRHTVFTYSRLILSITLPVVLVLIYFSEPVVSLLFQRGAFTERDTYLVGTVQSIYLLQVPPYVVGMLFVRLLSALKANHLMMWGNVINLTVCVVLSYILMQRYGVMGIALATSLMYVMSCCFLYVASMHLLKKQAKQSYPSLNREY